MLKERGKETGIGDLRIKRAKIEKEEIDREVEIERKSERSEIERGRERMDSMFRGRAYMGNS